MQNHRERLYELIRKEEVLIFAGAGLSLYAGFPSGQQLKNIIYESLTVTEKEEISINYNLTDLSEQVVRIRNNNRNALIGFLNNSFLKNPTTFPHVHKKIASIPHFKTIITTNYDKLIEESYKDKCQVLISDKQVPYIDRAKVQVFKIHGDLSDPNSIIISQSDYNAFFKNNSEHTIYWSVIKERLSTKNILFLGYNLEDPNVAVVFDKITEALKENRRESFFVSPNLSEFRKNDLLRKGITYIEDTAEKLIDGLLQNIKDNIATDLKESIVSTDTFNKFLNNLDLLPELQGVPGSFNLKAIKGLKGQINAELKFTFRKEHNEVVKDFMDFSQGKRFGEFELSDKEIETIRIDWGNLKMPEIESGYKLKFIDKPKIITRVDIRFEDGYQYNNFPVKVYGSPFKIEVISDLPFIDLNMQIHPKTFPNPTCDFTYQHKRKCGKVNEEIEFHEFLWRLCSKMKVSIFKNSKKVAEHQSPDMHTLVKDAKFYLRYFKNLEFLEKHYNLQFKNIDFNQIDEKLFSTVSNLLNIIKNGYFEIKLENQALLEFTEITSETISELEKLGQPGNKFEYEEEQSEFIELHGHKLDLGNKVVEILEPYVVNLEEMRQKKLKFALLESRIQKIKVLYYKT